MRHRDQHGGTLLDSITAYCRQAKIAESTFGRLAVNDGKFVSRLRDGSRVTPETWQRIADYIARKGGNVPTEVDDGILHVLADDQVRTLAAQVAAVKDTPESGNGKARRDFRFFDNRQKYLLFINTCTEKEKVSERVGEELAHLRPTPPALRLFDAGFGDGTILTRVMRQMHSRYPTLPFYVAGKEISLEDVRLTLGKLADRIFEHPATVVVFTNMYYSEAPWLKPLDEKLARKLVWKEVALSGSTAHEFEQQIRTLEEFLVENWQARHSPKTGNPIYDHPAVLVIYREDYRFLLHNVIPRQDEHRADFDVVIASQPYRSRMSAEFKVGKVVAPLTRALAPGGRLLGVHSYGNDPGLEIIHQVWPGENPFTSSRHDILNALKRELGDEASQYQFCANSDDRALFSYEMNALPTEISASIGTSTLFAAWNAAVYVAQIEDDRLNEVMAGRTYLDATHKVLSKYGGLWFNDEAYLVVRKPGSSPA
jgi:hypothetical protein